jgi:hypothetical protein
MLSCDVIDGRKVSGLERRQRKTASAGFDVQALSADADIDFAAFRERSTNIVELSARNGDVSTGFSGNVALRDELDFEIRRCDTQFLSRESQKHVAQYRHCLTPLDNTDDCLQWLQNGFSRCAELHLLITLSSI